MGFNIIANKGYRKMGTVVGTARFQVRRGGLRLRRAGSAPLRRSLGLVSFPCRDRPQLQHPDIQYRETPAQHKYCGNGTFIAPGSNVVMPQYPCKYVDEYDIVFPPIEAGACRLDERVGS